MSWITDVYDHLHDDLNLPELPGMDRDRVEDIVAEAFAPGSPLYQHMRHNSQVAEFLLPGLDLNFEENYNDFYGDLVGDDRTNASETTTEGGTESTPSPSCHCDEGEAPEEDCTPPVAEEPCDPPVAEEPCDQPAEEEGPEAPPEYFYPLPGEEGPPEWNMPVYPPVVSSGGVSEQVFRYMAGGDRELSAAELMGSIDEAQFDCSPHDRAIRDFSGIVDINDDCSVSKFESETTINMMDADRNGTVSLAELRKFLDQLGGAA